MPSYSQLNRMTRPKRRPLGAVGLALIIGIGMSTCIDSVKAQQADSSLRCDPTKVVSAEQCMKCHASEYNVWKNTPHSQTFEELHRSSKAQEIAQKMQVNSIKRGGMCIECHYTAEQKQDKLRPISGVSCESCHGAALDWLTVHNDYGAGANKQSESKDHNDQRVRMSIELGMRNPNNPYLIARSCLSCHTVPREDLVEQGGHSAGSANFELVSWSQGSIRHRFLESNGTENRASGPARLRLIYLCGVVADLEFSTRATARASRKSTFGMTAAKRAADNAIKLKSIYDQSQHPVLKDILACFAKAELRTNNEAQLTQIANQIQQHGQRLALDFDASTFAFLDAQIPTPENYK
jgi:Cytochrome c554 and c-prime